ncbi:MAG: DUF3574 domain-containing protein [Nitrospira sp.]|nr:DUF3574 domain-containing protein [Nitrospira sp.]
MIRNALSVVVLSHLWGVGRRLVCLWGWGQRAVQELLYFGTEMPSGHVSPQDWAHFLNEIVTPRFPNGFSTWHASGQWRSASGDIIRESSYVLSLLHSEDVDQEQAIRELINSYKTRFHQEQYCG